jgi:hypothetical protein
MNPSYRIYIRPTLEMPLREVAERAVEFEGLQGLERVYRVCPESNASHFLKKNLLIG